MVEPYDQEIGKLLDEAMGENSVFYGKTGYYAHVILPAAKDMLPRGWEERSFRRERTRRAASIRMTWRQ